MVPAYTPYKPREEQSYKDFHPHLNVKKKLRIYDSKVVDSFPEKIPDNLSLDLKCESSDAIGDYIFTPAVNSNTSKNDNNYNKRHNNDENHNNTLKRSLDEIVLKKENEKKVHDSLHDKIIPAFKPSFRKALKYDFKKPHVNQTMKEIGYQIDNFYERPEEYIIDESIEPETNIPEKLEYNNFKVEYDMDEQDDKFLSLINSRRKESYKVSAIPPEIFEITITCLEREWFHIEKQLITKRAEYKRKQKDPDETTDEALCAICADGECENSNAIVFCDGCDIAVHQDCYGVPFIPEGQWLCRRCMITPNYKVRCLLCPNIDGAFKQTDTGHWAHLMCALWVPETTVGNSVYMEPIQYIEHISKSRWKLVCFICKQKMGACIQCISKYCFTAYHATCAKRSRLYMTMKDGAQGAMIDPFGMVSYCDKHSPQEWKDQHETEKYLKKTRDFFASLKDQDGESHRDRTPFSEVENDLSNKTEKANGLSDSKQIALPKITLSFRGNKIGLGSKAIDEPVSCLDSSFTLNSSSSSTDLQQLSNKTQNRKRHHHKQKNQYSKKKRVWRTSGGTPLVPAVVYENVCSFLSRFSVTNLEEYVSEVCKYWTLKREMKRGASLIKRFKIALELSCTEEKDEDALEHAKNLEFLKILRKDIEILSIISNTIELRQWVKLQSCEEYKKILDNFYFPLNNVLLSILELARKIDEMNYFEDTTENKTYLKSINNPITFGDIKEKINRGEYLTVDMFEDDINLLLNNAQDYYWRTHPANKVIGKIRKDILPLIKEAVKFEKKIPFSDNSTVEYPELESDGLDISVKHVQEATLISSSSDNEKSTNEKGYIDIESDSDDSSISELNSDQFEEFEEK